MNKNQYWQVNLQIWKQTYVSYVFEFLLVWRLPIWSNKDLWYLFGNKNKKQKNEPKKNQKKKIKGTHISNTAIIYCNEAFMYSNYLWQIPFLYITIKIKELQNF